LAEIRVGDRAPDFALRSQEGDVVALSDLLSRGSVVVYFYPKDDTPGCSAEAGAFRDSYSDFRKLGTEVIGISSDSVGSHKHFAEDCKLPFRILSDADGEVRKKYGVHSSLGLIPGRVTFVIDKSGIVRYVFSSQLQPSRHVKEALKGLGPTGSQSTASGN
jgi:peroxiredoxin Q/BCP